MKDLKSQFVDWLETKPADERYNFCQSANCAVTQFARAVGYPHLCDVGDLEKAVPVEIYDAVNSDEDWTFGALRERLVQP